MQLSYKYLKEQFFILNNSLKDLQVNGKGNLEKAT